MPIISHRLKPLRHRARRERTCAHAGDAAAVDRERRRRLVARPLLYPETGYELVSCDPFGSATFGRLRLRNRIVMAPMTRRMAAEDGLVTPDIVEYYRRRAAGEVGLIVSEGTGIDSEHAFDTATVPRFETEAHHEAWKRVVDAVHEEGGAFAPQLWHCGRHAHNPIGPIDEPVPRPERAATSHIRGHDRRRRAHRACRIPTCRSSGKGHRL